MSFIRGLVTWMRKRWRRLTLAFVGVMLAVFAAFAFAPQSDARRALRCVRSGMTIKDINAAVGREFVTDWTNEATWSFDDKSLLVVLFRQNVALQAGVYERSPDWLTSAQDWLGKNSGVPCRSMHYDPLP